MKMARDILQYPSSRIHRMEYFPVSLACPFLLFATTRVEGNAAWVAFTDIATVTMNGKITTDNFLESAYLTKVNGAWKVQMIHSVTVTSYVK